MNVLPLGGSCICSNITMKSTFSMLEIVSTIATKIYELTLHYFGLLQNAFLVGFGVKDVLVDFIPMDIHLNKGRAQKKIILVNEIGNHYFYHLKKIQGILAEYSLIHGIFYLGSGLCGGLASLHDMQWLNLGIASPIARYLGSGLFLYANLYSLEQNIKLFYHAQKMSEKGKGEALTLANRLQVSAVLGIINNIGYIMATVFSLFPGTLSVAIALGCFAIFTGALKILYDYFYVNSKLNQMTQLT